MPIRTIDWYPVKSPPYEDGWYLVTYILDDNSRTVEKARFKHGLWIGDGNVFAWSNLPYPPDDKWCESCGHYGWWAHNFIEIEKRWTDYVCGNCGHPKN